MKDGIILLYFFAGLAGLIIDIFVSLTFRDIAEMKGHTESSKYFWWTFFTGIIGMLMVVALPDRAVKANTSAAFEKRPTESIPSDELPDL